MEYKLEERTLDLQELLESCQTRVRYLLLMLKNKCGQTG